MQNGNFYDIPGQQRLAASPARIDVNVINFPPVVAPRIRVVGTKAGGAAFGITEVEVANQAGGQGIGLPKGSLTSFQVTTPGHTNRLLRHQNSLGSTEVVDASSNDLLGRKTIATPALPGGTWTLGDLSVTRFGCGAMQLGGPGVMGPPADRGGALAVLRRVVELGIAHIDTSDACGPHVTDQLIREAPHVVTKVGAFRDARGGGSVARAPVSLRHAVHDNLETLGLEVLDLVNLRMGNAQGPSPARWPRPSGRWSNSSSRDWSGISA